MIFRMLIEALSGPNGWLILAALILAAAAGLVGLATATEMRPGRPFRVAVAEGLRTLAYAAKVNLLTR
jgi:hypothetical protein